MKRVLCLLFLAAVAAPQELHFAADRPWDLTHLRVEGRIDLKRKSLKATATLHLTALRTTDTVRLDAVHLLVSSVKGAASYTNDGTTLEVRLPEAAARGKKTVLEIAYTCADPEGGLYFYGPTETEPDVPYQVWSQGETITTRHWIPVFDHPNERMTSELVITVDDGLQVLSNGALVSRKDNTWHWSQRKDHTPYLIMLVVGKFAIEKEEWRGKPVEYWVPPDRKADIKRSFGNTLRMLDFFSDSIGVEYPWAKYAQIVVEQFSWGGMENTSATTLNERTLHDAKAHRDYSSDGLVAHELAHQWFGDLLTCRDWAHTWLNEGFASYFEALWNEHDQGDDSFRYNMLGKARGAIRGGTKLPIVHRAYKGPWEQFDARAYPKGAWVLHMVRRRLGDARWWKAIRHYTTKHALTTVETVDLRKAIEEATGESFERFFHDWTARPGHPVVGVTHRWHSRDNLMEVRIRQTQKGAAFHFPLRLEYRSGDGTEAVRHEVTEKEARFFVPLKERPKLVRVDPGFSVLMELKEDKGRDLWLSQLRDDPDPIARIRAALHFGDSKRNQDRRALASALGSETFWGVQVEIAKALGKSGGEICRDVLLGALGTENHKARQAVVDALGKFSNDATVESALEGIVTNGDASYSVEAAAIRAWARQRPEGALARLRPMLDRKSHNEVLRTAALAAIGDQAEPESTDLLITWSRRGRPRACRTAALTALGKVARGGRLDDAATQRVVNAVTLCLHKIEHKSIKRTAATTLRDMGEAATPALVALEALVEHDPNSGVRDEAGKAVEKIRSGAPARLELKRLRDELARQREAERKLRRRLEKLERKQPLPTGQ